MLPQGGRKETQMNKTVFISIVGRPNVGKSTLMNRIIGEKVAIVSNKPQTTRNSIHGIHTKGEDQFVFIDTPGIHRPKNRLGDYMVNEATSTMRNGDVVLLVADAGRAISEIEQNVIKYVEDSGTPCVLALNKIDEYNREQLAETIAKYAALHNFDAVVPICARTGNKVGELMDELSKFLVESEWFYPDDEVTDQPMRAYVAEIIREKILRTLNEEIPHGVAVVIEEYTETKTMVTIRAEIFCERASHKRIIIGKGGGQLKLVGTYAREELEKVCGKKVYLNLWVKVKENWRESDGLVRNFGYKTDDED